MEIDRGLARLETAPIRPGLSDPDLGAAAGVGPERDLEWQARVELEIAPHPDLTAYQRAAIAIDYGMVGECLILRPRAAVVYYVKRRLGLTEGHRSRPAADQPIVLVAERPAKES